MNKQIEKTENKTTEFDKFLTCWVFVPQNDVSINLQDLMTYSAMSFSKSFGKYPSNGQISWKTGIHRNTIPNCIQRLQELGLLENRTPIEKDWFKRQIKKPDQLIFWKCLIRTPESKLTFCASAIFSYLWYRELAGWKPQHGWTASYLATCLQLANKTVLDGLETLQKMRLLHISKDGDWIMPASLSGKQLDHFIQKDTSEVKQVGKSVALVSPDEFSKLFENEVNEEIPETKEPDSMSMSEYMQDVHKLSGMKDYDLINRIVRQIKLENNWVENWKSLIDDNLSELNTADDKNCEVVS